MVGKIRQRRDNGGGAPRLDSESMQAGGVDARDSISCFRDERI